jgi:hypothetical protein
MAMQWIIPLQRIDRSSKGLAESFVLDIRACMPKNVNGRLYEKEV